MKYYIHKITESELWDPIQSVVLETSSMSITWAVAEAPPHSLLKQTLNFNRIPRWFQCALKFEKH